MHKRIRVVENICHMSEQKYAQIHYSAKYSNPKTRADAIKDAHKHFKVQFKKQLGIKYFVPDPVNGGNSNCGNQIKRLLENISTSAAILEISPETLYRVGKCCNFINSTTFVNPTVYDHFSRAAFNSIMCDLGNFANITANTHALLCHASLYIRWAQNDLHAALGDLSEDWDHNNISIHIILSYTIWPGSLYRVFLLAPPEIVKVEIPLLLA